jgi:NTE family protein
LFATWKAKEAIEIGYTFTKELIKEQIRKWQIIIQTF